MNLWGVMCCVTNCSRVARAATAGFELRQTSSFLRRIDRRLCGLEMF